MDQNKLYDLMFAILKFLCFKVSVASFKFFLCFSITKGCFAPLHAGISQKEYVAMNRLVPVKVETGCFLFASLSLVLQAIIAWDSEYKL